MGKFLHSKPYINALFLLLLNVPLLFFSYVLSPFAIGDFKGTPLTSAFCHQNAMLASSAVYSTAITSPYRKRIGSSLSSALHFSSKTIRRSAARPSPQRAELLVSRVYSVSESRRLICRARGSGIFLASVSSLVFIWVSPYFFFGQVVYRYYSFKANSYQSYWHLNFGVPDIRKSDFRRSDFQTSGILRKESGYSRSGLHSPCLTLCSR